MNSETKTCQNCKQQFVIEPEDFQFYEKIQVPPPTFCVECRAQRRFVFRNEKTLFKRKSDISGKEIFSIFSPEFPGKVYERDYWLSDKWDGLDYGRVWNSEVSFLEQVKGLMLDVPWFNLAIVNLKNSDYCNGALDLNNCYLLFNCGFDTDCAYCIALQRSVSCFNMSYANSCESSAHSFNIHNSFKAFYSVDCENCSEIWFCRDCIGCSNCFGCAGLRNKNYYIFNQPYPESKYRKRISEINTGSYKNIIALKDKTSKLWNLTPRKYMHGRHNNCVTGDYIYESKNIKNSFLVENAENCSYSQLILYGPNKDSMDITITGVNGELNYETCEFFEGGQRGKFSWLCGTCFDVEYCMNCDKCTNCFGCVGLKNKQYCILNKQYSKTEYKLMLEKIIQNMNDKPFIDLMGRIYRYGEFFPIEFSPFAYNESLAQEFSPLSQGEVEKLNYKWRDMTEKNYKITVKAEDIPDDIREVNKDVLNETFGCEHRGLCNEQCTRAFKVIPSELQFYKKANLPLPRLCPNCRHYERVAERTSFKLWHRQCMCKSDKHFHKNICPNEFETSYSPERKEIIYCEQCYNAEIA